MKIGRIKTVNGKKLHGLKFVTKRIDFRIGFLPLGNPDKRFFSKWERLKLIVYYRYAYRDLKHFRFLWFGVSWKTILGVRTYGRDK